MSSGRDPEPAGGPATARASARALPQADGFEVVGDIADGGEALAAVLGLQPDIVLLDIQLPNCDGFAVAEQEHDVLSLLAEGMSNRAVASRLFITERTVEAHVTQIFNKLGLADSADRHRRVLAVLAYLRT